MSGMAATMETMARTPAMEAAAPAGAKGQISIRNVTKVYDPDGARVLAVDDCCMEIEAGEFCVVVGPSGCGKTTLLNAIAGFHGISAGEIWLDGPFPKTAGTTNSCR